MEDTANKDALLPQEESLPTSGWGWRSALSFAFALALLAFFASRLNVDVGNIWQTIRGADMALVAAGFVSYYLIFPIRGWRWSKLLGNVSKDAPVQYTVPPLSTLAEITFLGWFVNCVMPAKLGDAYRAYQFKRVTKGSLSSALGTIFAERFLDVVVLATLLIGALLTLGAFNRGSDSTPTALLGASMLLLVVGAIGLTAMWTLRERLPSLMPQRVQAIYSRFQHGILGSFQNMLVVAPLSTLVWFAEVGRVYFVVQAMDLDLALPYIVLLALTQALLTVVPFTPGGLGLVETGLVGLLLFAGIPKEIAVATALLDRTISYWSVIVLGFILFFIRRRV